MKQIFISYAREDKEAKEKLRNNLIDSLDNRRFNVWDDSKIPAARFEKIIKKEIRKSCIYILLISGDYVESHFVKKEIDWILKSKKSGNLLIPIILKDYNKEKVSELLPSIRQYQYFPKNYENLDVSTNQDAVWNENTLDICLNVNDAKSCKSVYTPYLWGLLIALFLFFVFDFGFNKQLITSSLFLPNLEVKSGEELTLRKSSLKYYKTILNNDSRIKFTSDEGYITFSTKKLVINGKAYLDASGESGSDGSIGKNGRKATKRCLHGESGQNGSNGTDGSNGKLLELEFAKIQFRHNGTLNIDLSGGDGGKGGKGGNGGRGGKADCNSKCPGGNGGNAGNGGNGGNSGSGGQLYAILPREYSDNFIINDDDGIPGAVGKSGTPGQAGKSVNCASPSGSVSIKGGTSGQVGKIGEKGSIKVIDEQYLKKLNIDPLKIKKFDAN